jgi:hypothetical protein
VASGDGATPTGASRRAQLLEAAGRQSGNISSAIIDGPRCLSGAMPFRTARVAKAYYFRMSRKVTATVVRGRDVVGAGQTG